MTSIIAGATFLAINPPPPPLWLRMHTAQLITGYCKHYIGPIVVQPAQRQPVSRADTG